MSTSVMFLSVQIKYIEFDRRIEEQLDILNDMNIRRYKYHGVEDFYTLKRLDLTLVTELFNLYIKGHDVDTVSNIRGNLMAILAPGDVTGFLICIVMPVLLDIGLYDIRERLSCDGVDFTKEVLYDSLIFKDEYISINFRVV